MFVVIVKSHSSLSQTFLLVEAPAFLLTSVCSHVNRLTCWF